MRVILIGCEYAGTTTLADGIQRWSHEVMGEGNGLRPSMTIGRFLTSAGIPASTTRTCSRRKSRSSSWP